tara:strand:- start:635 stop:1297 length:663 start_codon:yes stop_codon:yes gene_type:complete
MKEYIKYIKNENPLENCIYFKDILNNKISLNMFKQVQYDFYPAVTFFSKPMLMICSKIDDYSIRWKILENIIDEHGSGIEKDNHGYTYKMFLINLGFNCDKIDFEKINQYILEFNSILMKECIENHWVKGAAMIAIMEDLYMDISKIIYKFLINNKYLEENKIFHYKLHKEVDAKHSDDMYNILSTYWNKSELNKDIRQGLYDGNNILLKLFSNLYLSKN